MGIPAAASSAAVDHASHHKGIRCSFHADARPMLLHAMRTCFMPLTLLTKHAPPIPSLTPCTQVLEGLDPVRKRPGMYIGSTGSRGLHHLVYEVLDNAVDEVQAGHASLVEVELDVGSGWVTVTDNGR